MKTITKFIPFVSLLIATTFSAPSFSAQQCPEVLKHMKRKLNSQEVVNLCEEYAGKAVLFVNTASKCGYTPQFEDLEKLYDDYKNQGLMVIGFPSNDFKQEFADESQTAEVCELTYGVSFPMFEPLSVRGKNADPLFAQLADLSGKAPKWNFNKYLMNTEGSVIKHYGSRVNPLDESFVKDIQKALKVSQ